MAQTLTLPDGRQLDYQVSGAPDGFPFVNFHGTPGAYNVGLGLGEACEKKGIKLISFSRPGYGGSSRRRGRKVVDVVDDVEALLKHLAVEKCAVMGRSGGGGYILHTRKSPRERIDSSMKSALICCCDAGPHTLACAARLPGCVAALSICGPAPYDAKGLNFLDGNGEESAYSNVSQKECTK